MHRRPHLSPQLHACLLLISYVVQTVICSDAFLQQAAKTSRRTTRDVLSGEPDRPGSRIKHASQKISTGLSLGLPQPSTNQIGAENKTIRATLKDQSSSEKNADRDEPGVDISPEPLSPEMRSRQKRIARCLSIYYPKYVDAEALAPWSIMHGLIAYGQESKISYKGKIFNAVQYLCANGIGRDKRLLFLHNGELKTQNGPGYQGHEGQLLAMFAQSHVPANFPITVEGRRFTVQDLIELEKNGCRSGSELTFQLIGLSFYLDSDATWQNDLSESWSISRLIREEIEQPINGAACGGTHRLMALSYALHFRRQSGKKIDGEWLRAAQFLHNYQELACQLQNTDGSYSTEWFEGRGADRSAKQRLYTTGHILEWMVYSLPQTRLDDPDVTAAVDYVTSLMLAAPNHDLTVGPRGHALHALRIYEYRMFGGNTDHRQKYVLNRKDLHRLNLNLDYKDAGQQPSNREAFQGIFGNRGGERRGLFRNR